MQQQRDRHRLLVVLDSGRFGETVGLACRPPPELGAVLDGQLFVQYPECRIEMLPG